MGSRLAGKRVIVTDFREYNGADIAALFEEEGAVVFADDRDLTSPSAADDLRPRGWARRYPHREPGNEIWLCAGG